MNVRYTPPGRPMDDAKKSDTILAVDADGEFAVVYWDPNDFCGHEFGWTVDGRERFEPVQWWPLPRTSTPAL